MQARILPFFSLIAAMPLAAAHAGSITDGDALVNYFPDSGPTITNLDLRPDGFAGLDHATQLEFFYRITQGPFPNANERHIGPPDAFGEVFMDNIATVPWSGVGQPNQRIDLDVQIVLSEGEVPNSCATDHTILVTNPNTNAIEFEFFLFIDPKAGGDEFNDTVTAATGGGFLITDPSGDRVLINPSGDWTWGIGTGTASEDPNKLRNELTDNDIDNFIGEPLPATRDDVALVFQWSFALNPGQSEIIFLDLGVNEDAVGCPGDVDGNFRTETADITFIVSNLGSGSIGAQGTPGDANGDGVTNTADITFAVSNLGCGS
ncbi:MAG: hypothetical protein AAGD00_04470 [Planctomycetota bacterium]